MWLWVFSRYCKWSTCWKDILHLVHLCGFSLQWTQLCICGGLLVTQVSCNKKSLLMHTFWSYFGSWITLKEWIGELAKFRRWSCCYRVTVNGHRCKYLILVIWGEHVHEQISLNYMVWDVDNPRIYLLFITVFMQLVFIWWSNWFQQWLQLQQFDAGREKQACSFQVRRKFK